MHQLTERNCPICNNYNSKVIGIRGNREYNGADANAIPHIVTNVVQCNECTHIYTNPEIRGLEHLEYNHYNNPDNYLSNVTEQVLLSFENRLQLMTKYLASNTTVLDVGAGKGEFVKAAIDKGFKAEGIEPSPKFCSYAKQQFNIPIHNGLLGQYAHLNHKQYDAITMNHVLEHIDEPNKLLQTISEHLVSNGKLFIEVPNCNATFLHIADWFYKLKGKNWSSRVSPLHAPFHKYGFTPASLQYVLQHNNYAILAIKTFSGSERGSHAQGGVLNKIAAVIANIIDAFGNRELLYIVAQKKN